MSVEQLINDFQRNKSWDKQYRLLIQLGKQLPALSETEKVEENLVKGCESLAWLVIEKRDQQYYFTMDSDARVVKGLMMILMIIFQGKSAQQIAEIDLVAIFTKLGLLNHLSPSRANGLLAIVDKIQGVVSCDKS
jgi:cysteine desulfuration protein SufE